MSVFTPVTEAESLYGEGDWRSVLGDNTRKDGWKFYMIGKASIEHRLRGVILPSFDFTLSLSDQSFPKSVAPCWTNQPQKGLERHFAANAFAIPIMMYPFLGEKNEHWLSPSNRKNMIGNDALGEGDADDAFDDLNRWVRRNKSFDQGRKDFLLKAPNLKEDAPVPGRTVRYVALAECKDKESDWHPAVIAFTTTAYSYLLEQMRWRHQDATPPRDPNWPSYMLGDVTDPNSAVEWHVDKVLLDPKDNQETNVICFTERREFLDEAQKVRKVRPEVVDKRFLMVSPDNWCIPTYEEQVEFMLSSYDAAVTADMIRAACSHRCGFEIPTSRPQRAVTSSETAAPSTGDRPTPRYGDEPVQPAAGGSLAPRASAPPMPRETAAEPTYWAGRPKERPTKMTVAALQAVWDEQGAESRIKVNVDGVEDWRPLADCGLIRIASAVPDDDVPMSVPDEDTPAVPDTPSTPPAATASQQPAREVTLEQMVTTLFPDPAVLDAMSPERQAEARELAQRAWVATDKGTKRDLPPDIVDDLMKLIEG